MTVKPAMPGLPHKTDDCGPLCFATWWPRFAGKSERRFDGFLGQHSLKRWTRHTEPPCRFARWKSGDFIESHDINPSVRSTELHALGSSPLEASQNPFSDAFTLELRQRCRMW